MELDLGEDPIGNSLGFLMTGQDAAEGFITVPGLGGYPMADHPAREVRDASRGVYSYPGRFTGGRSIVPTAAGVNSSETIAALAKRDAGTLVADGVPATGLRETRRLDGDGGG